MLVALSCVRLFFFKQKTAYEMRISDWSSDVCSSDLVSAPESIRFPAGQKAGGTLSLVVASGFAPMMQHVLPEIVERVNRFFGYNAVAKVAMRQGEVERREPERRPAPKMLKPVPSEDRKSTRLNSSH